jgi:hypothetical protein
MKQLSAFLLVLLLALIPSCEDENEIPDFPWMGIVNGMVTINGEPAQGVFIRVDSDPQWMDTTDVYGGFQISGVSKYEHYVTVEKSLDSGRFIYLYRLIQMGNEGVNMRTLNFEAPSNLWVSDTVINNKKAKILKWNKAKEDFLNYKIYKQSMPNINQGSSVNNIIGISEVKDDTMMIDDSNTASSYYYKVFTYYPMYYKTDLKITGSKEVYK